MDLTLKQEHESSSPPELVTESFSMSMGQAPLGKLGREKGKGRGGEEGGEGREEEREEKEIYTGTWRARVK